MTNLTRLILAIFIFPFVTNINAQPQTATVGETSQLKFNISNVTNTNKCHIEVTLPNQQKVGVEVDGPQFLASVEFTPQQIGNAVVQWEGKNKLRGLKSVFGCPGSGVIQVQVNGNTEQIAQKWNQYFSSVNEEIRDCVKVGMDLSQLKYQVLADPAVTLTSPQDQQLKPIYEKCESFAKQNQPRKGAPCTLPSQNNLKTICDGVYAERQPDGRLKTISRTAAIQLQFEGKPWTVGVLENLDVRTARLKQEGDDKAKQAEELAAKKEADEKERLFKLSPEYKKQQAALEIKRIADEKEAARKQAEQEKIRVADINKEFETVRGFLDRKIDWKFAIKNQDNFPVYISPQEIYITPNKELIVNSLIQFEKHYDGGISSIFTLKVSNCFLGYLPSYTRIRHRYFSEISGRGVVIKDNVINEETIIVELGRNLVWHTVASHACSEAKKITENYLQKHEIIQKQLSVLNTQAGIEFYKKYQAEDEKNTKENRLALEDKSRREKYAQDQARSKALEGKLLFAGLVNTLNTGTLAGSCKSVFSHLAIHTNKLWSQTIAKPAKNQDDEFRNRKEADQYLRAGELGRILSDRVGSYFSKNVLPSEQRDYFESVSESMAKMSNLNDPKIAYEAFNYCRNKF